MGRLLALGLVIGFSGVFAADRPGDSVINGKFRGGSKLEIDGGVAQGYSTILDEVMLTSQKTPNIFVRYGPFTNTGPVALEISMQHLLSDGEHTLVGIVEGAEVASHPAYIQFTVSPGKTFFVQAKGAATLSAVAAARGLSNSDVGLPSATDFLEPVGQFHSCIEIQQEISGDGVYIPAGRRYFYVQGTMSDKSHSFDQIGSYTGFTTGVPPRYPVTCEIRHLDF